MQMVRKSRNRAISRTNIALTGRYLNREAREAIKSLYREIARKTS